MNLDVTPVRVIDCLIYCRGNAMEEARPEDFSLPRLVNWFVMNIRTLKHLSHKKDKNVDQEWLEDYERYQ